jgi:hypothetical protein
MEKQIDDKTISDVISFGDLDNWREKYNDSRWQKKSNKIRHRDGMKCMKCGRTDAILTAHHLYYIYGNDPWDCPDDWLVTMCRECHDEEAVAKEYVKDIARVFRLNYFASTLKMIRDYLVRTNGEFCMPGKLEKISKPFVCDNEDDDDWS